MAAQNEVLNFLPSRNGWPFPNDLSGTFPVVTLPVIGTIASADAGDGVCGGFTFTVRDLFEHRPLLAPDVNAAKPSQGSPTFGFLTSRFLDSLGPTGYANAVKAITWTQTSDHDVLLGWGLGHQMAATEWPAVKSTIDSGHLCPLYIIRAPQVGALDIPGIIDALGHSHQVLAYRYEIDDAADVTIGIYDPNDPADDTSVITLNVSNPTGNVGLGAPGIIANIEDPQYKVRGFFAAQYVYKDPTSFGADVVTVNNAQFVSQSVPANLGIGNAVSVTMRNTGGRAWSPSLGHRLGSQSPQDNALWGTNREQLAGDVPPGQEATFNFTLTSVPSSHATFQWRMVQEGVEWFGDFTPPVPFDAPNDAICAQLTGEITALQNEIAELQKNLQHAAGSEKMSLIRQIAQDDIKLGPLQRQKQQNGCP